MTDIQTKDQADRHKYLTGKVNQARSTVNDQQIGGNHYKKEGGEQHWDRVHRLGLNWYAANVTKYVERYREKNGVQDLLKAKHYLEKLIEVESMDKVALGYGAVMSGEAVTAPVEGSFYKGNREQVEVIAAGAPRTIAEWSKAFGRLPTAMEVAQNNLRTHPYDGRETTD